MNRKSSLLIAVSLIFISAETGLAQRFAAPQPRAPLPSNPPPRLAPASTAGYRTPIRRNESITRPRSFVPAPSGVLPRNSGVPQVGAGRFNTGGALVQIPESAEGTGSQIYTFTDRFGRRISLFYNPSANSAVLYDQTTTYGLSDRSRRFGNYQNRFKEIPTIATQPGQGAGSGLQGNTTLGIRRRGAIPTPGIPRINPASPSARSLRGSVRTGLGSSSSVGSARGAVGRYGGNPGLQSPR